LIANYESYEAWLKEGEKADDPKWDEERTAKVYDVREVAYQFHHDRPSKS
jgi:hypothetical protein